MGQHQAPNIKYQISNALEEIVKDLTGEVFDLQISIPEELKKGDFTSNIAMRLGGKLGSPMEAGEKIIEKIRENHDLYSKFSNIELAHPGFINFWLSEEELTLALKTAVKGFEAKEQKSSLVFEFGDPNPFKEPHIGHLRNLALGESLSRLFEFNGVKVVRVNYQGDVGMHVAKCLWGILQVESPKLKVQNLDNDGFEEKAKFLGEAYRLGAEKFEKNENAKKEIISINNKIYTKDTEITHFWEIGRRWSLDYFEQLYKKLDIKYEKYYFESEVAQEGRGIVENNLDVFETDDRAFVFRAEQFGLHTRVFVNSLGHPTYEAKDLALAFLKDKDFPEIDKSIIMTANEQIDYFKVLLKALEKIDVKIATKTFHLSFGFVNLKEGKMSSRSGNIVNANWLLDETKKLLKKGFKEVPDEVLETLAVGAVKWSMLKFSRESDMAFSIEESVDLAGYSGPYTQYTYARIGSLLVKSEIGDFEAISVKNPDQDLLALMRLVCQFEMVVKDASDRFSPNHLTQYLFILAKNFNSFYEKKKIIGSPREDEILLVCLSVKNTIGKGLNLLGISTPEKI